MGRLFISRKKIKMKRGKQRLIIYGTVDYPDIIINESNANKTCIQLTGGHVSIK